MGIKLAWYGLSLYVLSSAIHLGSPFAIAGAIVLAIGAVLICLDK